MSFNPLHAHRWAELVRRLTDAQIENLSPEVIPVLVLESDRPEWGFSNRTRLWQVSASILAGGAGTFAQLAIGTENQDLVTVIQRLRVTAAAYVEVLTGLSGFSAGSAAGMRDGRWRANASTKVYTKNTGVVSLVSSSLSIALNTTEQFYDGPWIISGSRYQVLIEAQATNTAMTVYAIGYERDLRPEERAT